MSAIAAYRERSLQLSKDFFLSGRCASVAFFYLEQSPLRSSPGFLSNTFFSRTTVSVVQSPTPFAG